MNHAMGMASVIGGQLAVRHQPLPEAAPIQARLVGTPWRFRKSNSGLVRLQCLMRTQRRRWRSHSSKHEKPDMIVMGRRGLSDLQGLLMGSVSHKVSHLADCACLTVK